MRMRRKRHLEERLTSRADYLIPVNNEEKNAKIAVAKKEYIDYKAIFGNDNPIVLEIGCGKGQFACDLAVKHPDRNIIAVERLDNVIVSACEKAALRNVPNVRFILSNAEYLEKYLPEHSVKKIYLNFAPPYKKNTYANRRLTYSRFLESYARLLTEDGEIYFKTDNTELFEYSLEEMSRFGYKLKDVSLDLTALNDPDNIVTEHEAKFVAMGKKIYRFVAYLGEKKQ